MSKDVIQINVDSLMPLRDVVYHTLRDAILKGELEPGERLMEIHLAERLGVSRTPVREAIRMLEKEGLAVTYPRKGAQVAKMTIKDLEDVLEIREVLDVLSSRNACDKITEKELEQLEVVLQEQRDAVKSGKVRKIVEKDESFHNIIYHVADNPKLQEILFGLREQMYRYRYEYVKNEDILKNLLIEHAQIIEALKNRDKKGVEKIMVLHLENQYKVVKETIHSQGE